MILGVNPVYTTWHSFGQTLLVDSLLISYIDVRHAKFLPPTLTTGEARNLGPRYTTADDLAPMRDEYTERVSQNRKRHVVVEQPEAPALAAEKEITDLVDTRAPNLTTQ